MKHTYAIVTPIKNDKKFLEITANSVLLQKLKPKKWIIINDGSTDGTGELIKKLEKENSWISGIDNFEEKKSKNRRIGGQAVIHLGLNKLDIRKYEFIVRMDADVSFESDFFENMFQKFEDNQKLGITSGVCYVQQERGKLVEEKSPRFHTRGPLKIYRCECYRDIGGLDKEEGWDTIDEIKANMKGWQTSNFPDQQVIHLRKTQSASGVLRGFKNVGITAYYTGYHPIFMLLRVFRNMAKKPIFFGGLYMFSGWIQGYLKKAERVDDKDFIKYIRKQQLNKILGRETIWR